MPAHTGKKAGFIPIEPAFYLGGFHIVAGDKHRHISDKLPVLSQVNMFDQDCLRLQCGQHLLERSRKNRINIQTQAMRRSRPQIKFFTPAPARRRRLPARNQHHTLDAALPHELFDRSGTIGKQMHIELRGQPAQEFKQTNVPAALRRIGKSRR